MKKLLVLLLTLLLALPALADTPVLTAEDFTLRLSEAEDAPVYRLGDDVAALLTGLEGYTGAPAVMTFEDADCMLPGMTREYVAADEMIIVATRPLPGNAAANTIESVMVLTPEVATPRGARIGMALAEIEALYGTDYVQDFDTVIYANGEFEPQILFFFDLDTWTVTGWMLFRNLVI